MQSQKLKQEEDSLLKEQWELDQMQSERKHIEEERKKQALG